MTALRPTMTTTTVAAASAASVLLLLAVSPLPGASSFVNHPRRPSPSVGRRAPFVAPVPSGPRPSFALSSNASPDDEDAAKSDEEGSALASEFMKIASQRNIGLDDADLLEDDDDEEEEEEKDDDEEDEDDEEEEINIPQGAINAFLGYDTGDVGDKLAGNVTLTNDQLYNEVKERVLDTAGGFVKLTRGPSEDDDEDDEEGEKTPKEYVTPDTVPDSGLTAGEVVTTVLDALLHNDVPTENRGVEVLFGYSSDASSIKSDVGLTPAEYREFLMETEEYKVLFDHGEVVIDKGDYSFDGKKAFFTARLRVGPNPLDFVGVNFILSTKGRDEDDCWLIDSMLIRPQGMRRRRRR